MTSDVIAQIREELELEAGLLPGEVLDRAVGQFGIDLGDGAYKQKVQRLAGELGIDTGWEGLQAGME
jgi:hypothetical protein